LKKLEHLSEIYNQYDTFIIDLWGVMHNGLTLNKKAMKVVKNLKKNSKKIVFLSNAPRPKTKVINFLLKMKMNKDYLSNVVTSGEAAMNALNKQEFGKKFSLKKIVLLVSTCFLLTGTQKNKCFQ